VSPNRNLYILVLPIIYYMKPFRRGERTCECCGNHRGRTMKVKGKVMCSICRKKLSGVYIPPRIRITINNRRERYRPELHGELIENETKMVTGKSNIRR